MRLTELQKAVLVRLAKGHRLVKGYSAHYFIEDGEVKGKVIIHRTTDKLRRDGLIQLVEYTEHRRTHWELTDEGQQVASSF